jgi:competence protein ComEA
MQAEFHHGLLGLPGGRDAGLKACATKGRRLISSQVLRASFFPLMMAQVVKSERLPDSFLYDRVMAFRPRVFATATAFAALLTVVLSAQASQPDARFPEGPGKAALFKVCADCHGPEAAVAQFKTRQEWSKTLDEMAANGAQGTNEEWNELLEYLDTNFSLILVNKADATHLAKTLDVPQAIAESIVKRRDEQGPITAIEDLKKVPGLDAAKVEARKDRFVF